MLTIRLDGGTSRGLRIFCYRASFLILATFLCAGNAFSETSAVGKVIASYIRENRTSLILETRVPLVSGSSVYIGEGIRAIVDDKLSFSTTPPATDAPKGLDEKAAARILNPSPEITVYYYGATIAGKQDVPKDALVRTEASAPASYLRVKMEEHYTFESKRNATVTARQGDRVMMNKGSLNEVADRDIYKVYGSDGRYKGLLELRGVGDFQSSGVLYNRLEDFHRNALKTEVGDKLVFVGQRKLFALGLLGGVRSSNETAITKKESTWGSGLLWNVTFPDGWGAEVLFGGYVRDVSDHFRDTTTGASQSVLHKAGFILPVWAKKNFFYPSIVSPFAAAGLSLMIAENQFSTVAPPNPSTTADRKVSTVVPVVGAGLEFFSGRFFRPRIEIRYFRGPTINAGNDSFRTSSLYYSAGFLTTW